MAALASSCLISTAYAENIKTIEVVADKIEPRSVTEVNPDDYNGFGSVVTRATFENRLTNLAELMNAMPSVQTFSTGGMGGYTSASVRGSTGKQVNIFVDGILLNSPASGYSNLGIIPTSIIEAIEVYPDYTPVQLSDGNLAGAINIRTRQAGSKGNGGKLSLGYASFATRKTEASLWGGNADTSALLAGSLLSSKNNFPVSPDLFPDLSAGQSRQRENAAFAQSDLFGKLKHALNDRFELQAMLNYANSHNELPTIQNKTETPATLDTDTLRSSIGIESVNIDHNWGLRLYSSAGNSRFKDLKRSIAMNTRQVDSDENTLGSTVYLESALAGHLLASSLDISQTRIEKHNQLGANEKIHAGRDKLTLAIADSWTPLPAFSLYGLARQYYIDDETDPGTASFSASCPGNDAQCLASTHQETSLQLGVRHQFAKNWGIKANIGKLLRMPTLAEKYGDTGNYVGDPRLKPEFSKSADTGLFFRSAQFRAELVVFGREVENGIYVSYDARGVGHPANISESRLAGIEFDSEWLMLDELSLSLSGFNMDSENRSTIKADQGKKVQGIYHNGYVAALTWSRHVHRLSTSYQVDDDLYYTPSNSVKAGKKDSWNIDYTATVEAWIFSFGINNILDNQYSDFNRMPSSGRSVNGNIHYEF